MTIEFKLPKNFDDLPMLTWYDIGKDQYVFKTPWFVVKAKLIIPPQGYYNLWYSVCLTEDDTEILARVHQCTGNPTSPAHRGSFRCLIMNVLEYISETYCEELERALKTLRPLNKTICPLLTFQKPIKLRNK